ncbi:hypothetical protein ymoll0001_13160 [Yersinia mollaretii ATCC 43969]|uniref:Transposase n=1 Tax=Yersinia mollaretii (strain ATCC 43969 / DSM 18520 / CIP 103324 / CNY 7263 / WAIP 204) TaxID=349967 RepID=A0ABP2E9B8_YERMW|nr:hypothetical protein ymoll0001_13160 [Yersinia mollaretii ATCC 43969]
MPIISTRPTIVSCQQNWFVFYPKQNNQYLAKSRPILSDNGKNV